MKFFKIIIVVGLMLSFTALKANDFNRYQFQYSKAISVSDFKSMDVIKKSERVLFIVADTSRLSINRNNLKRGTNKDFTVVISHWGDSKVKQEFEKFEIEPIDANLFYYVNSELVSSQVVSSAVQDFTFSKSIAKVNERLTIRRKFYDIEVLTSQGCPYCTMLKACLDEASITYREYDYFEYEDKRDEFIKKSGQTYTPQTMIDGRIVETGFNKNNKLCERISKFKF